AEELVFGAGNVTTGAVSDIEQATQIAREMAGRFGMVDELGRVNYLGRASDGQGAASPVTLARVDEGVARKLAEAYVIARRILAEERAGLEALAERLIEAETVTGAEALRIVDAALPAARLEAAE